MGRAIKVVDSTVCCSQNISKFVAWLCPCWITVTARNGAIRVCDGSFTEIKWKDNGAVKDGGRVKAAWCRAGPALLFRDETVWSESDAWPLRYSVSVVAVQNERSSTFQAWDTERYATLVFRKHFLYPLNS